MTWNPSTAANSQDIAPGFIRDNFQLRDRLAVVLLEKRTDAVVQRLASAEQIAAPDFQAWLRNKNARRQEVYIAMNALRPDAHGRTKADVGFIRHVYLDFDHQATQAVERLIKRPDLPPPNSLVNTSPDKWQVVWKVDGFTKDQAEELQRGLARETGADPAATDCSRVLRLPGFYNHKYAGPHLVRVQTMTGEIYGPERFPKFPADERGQRITGDAVARPTRHPNGLSQSEKDWAFAKRALSRGDPEDMVIAAIATQRRYDKHNPQYYAELTVRKAAESLRAGATEERGLAGRPDR